MFGSCNLVRNFKLLNMRILTSILLLSLFLSVGCASKKFKDVEYLQPDLTTVRKPTLNIFIPKNGKKDNPVLLFVHGGNWSSGDKKTYSLLGRNFAKKGITTVIVGYTLSPYANYDQMAMEIGKAVEWADKNISKYNGDPNQIYLTGHSSGGHLVALVGTNPRYLHDKSIVKGIILNDAFCLDMKSYLEVVPPTEDKFYLSTWSSNPKAWKDGSPIYHLDKTDPPFMVYLGEKTYDGILITNEMFMCELNKIQPEVQPIYLKNMKHVPMVVQYFFPWNKRFDEVIEFMGKNREGKKQEQLADSGL